MAPLLAAGVFLLAGCLSIKEIPGGIEPSARPLEYGRWEELKEAEAESSGFKLFWVLPVTAPADFSQAVDEAIGTEGGDNLINVRWHHERQVWILGTVEIIRVKGKVIRYER